MRHKIRVRQHVNPLAQKYRTPANPVDWEKVYAQFNQPLHLDIGCARGQFLLSMAQDRTRLEFYRVGNSRTLGSRGE